MSLWDLTIRKIAHDAAAVDVPAVRLAPVLPAWAPLVAACECALRDMRGVAAVWDARFEVPNRMTAPVRPVPMTLCGGHARPAPHPWADLAAACERACRTMQPPQEDEVRNLSWWAAEWRRRAVARKLCRQWTWRGQG